MRVNLTALRNSVNLRFDYRYDRTYRVKGDSELDPRVNESCKSRVTIEKHPCEYCDCEDPTAIDGLCCDECDKENTES